jgi:hypothetical protein
MKSNFVITMPSSIKLMISNNKFSTPNESSGSAIHMLLVAKSPRSRSIIKLPFEIVL